MIQNGFVHLYKISKFNLSCIGSEFACYSETECIPYQWKCDGEAQCRDESDEWNCNTTRKYECMLSVII